MGLDVVRELTPRAAFRFPFPLSGRAYGPSGESRWGTHGAAGLLLHDPQRGVLLQQRSMLVDDGGTWSIPGGACDAGESALDAALREAHEEAGIVPPLVRVTGTHVLDLGWWRYTTVLAEAAVPIDFARSNWEATRTEWVPVSQVASRRLQPDFAQSWPDLASMLTEGALV
ncbi:NUDIX hydrolase [Microbacterium sp. NPDC079995]